MMNKPILIAMTNPVSPAREAEFNRWYDEVHARDILRLPGMLSISRYRGLEQIRPDAGPPRYRYLAIYEMDGPTAPVAALVASRPTFQMSDALAPDPLAISFTPIYFARRDGAVSGDS
jgi:hypothetical protein